MQGQWDASVSPQFNNDQKVFRPEDFNGDKGAALTAAIKHAKELTGEKPEYQVRPTKKINFVHGLTNKNYPGTKVILVDCVWQLFERLGRMLSNSDNVVAWFDRQAGEIIVVLDHIQNPAQVGFRLFAANLRLNLEQYIRDNNSTREQFFGTGNEADQIRMEERLGSFFPGCATLSDKIEAGAMGLFKGGGTNRFGFRDAECRVLIDKLQQIAKSRKSQGGYVKYIPINGPEELL